MIWKFKSCEICCCIRWLVLSVVNDHSTFTLKVKHLYQSLLTSWSWRWRHCDSSKHWELITSQKTQVFSNEVLKTSNHTWKTCIRMTSIWAFLVWPSWCTCACYDLVIANEQYIIHNWVLEQLVVPVHFVFHKYQFLYYVYEVSCGCTSNCRNLNLWNVVCTAESTNWLLSWNWLQWFWKTSTHVQRVYFMVTCFSFSELLISVWQLGCAVAPVVSCQPLIVEVWLLLLVSPCGFYVDKVALGQVFDVITSLVSI
jgi:hypothetical protein